MNNYSITERQAIDQLEYYRRTARGSQETCQKTLAATTELLTEGAFKKLDGQMNLLRDRQAATGAWLKLTAYISASEAELNSCRRLDLVRRWLKQQVMGYAMAADSLDHAEQVALSLYAEQLKHLDTILEVD